MIISCLSSCVCPRNSFSKQRSMIPQPVFVGVKQTRLFSECWTISLKWSRAKSFSVKTLIQTISSPVLYDWVQAHCALILVWFKNSSSFARNRETQHHKNIWMNETNKQKLTILDGHSDRDTSKGYKQKSSVWSVTNRCSSSNKNYFWNVRIIDWLLKLCGENTVVWTKLTSRL